LRRLSALVLIVRSVGRREGKMSAAAAGPAVDDRDIAREFEQNGYTVTSADFLAQCKEGTTRLSRSRSLFADTPFAGSLAD
jgi:hypothetical protein